MNVARRFWRARAALLAGLLGASVAHATPSTVIWIPSVDVQPFLVIHLHSDVYVRVQSEPDGKWRPPLYLIGPTMGVLPWSWLQLEIGFDLMFQGSDADKYPIYFHAKLATPEDAMFKWSPGLAGGVYNLGVAAVRGGGDVRILRRGLELEQ